MAIDDDDDWSPDSDVVPGRKLPAAPEPRVDREPDGVRMRREREEAFLREQDVVPQVDDPPPRAAASVQTEWQEFGNSLEPGVMQLLRRRPPELLQILKWLQYIGAYKEGSRKELKLRLPSIKLELSFPFMATQADDSIEVFLLPPSASGLKMELGASVEVLEPGVSRQALFIGCFELPMFPFKFMLLGVAAPSS